MRSAEKTQSQGILAWPLGWAAASIGTSNLIYVATEQGLVVAGSIYGLQTMLAAAVVGGWIIITTLIAPVIIQNAISTGAQVGSALLGGALTAGASAISAGTTTGAALASGGVGALGIAAGAGAAAAGSLGGSTMQGGSSPLSGSLMQSLAHSLPRGRSSSGSSESGKSTQSGGGSTPAPAAKAYDASDAGNDREVQQMIDQAKQSGGKA